MRKFLVLGLAVAAVPVGIAFAESDGLKVTGGGQAVVSEDATGPGDTIAFNAQQVAGTATGLGLPAKGQLQVVDRDDAGGGQGVKYHGIVTCIRAVTRDDSPGPAGDYVRFGGFQKVAGKKDMTQAFTVDARDNGEGINLNGADLVIFRKRPGATDPCDDDDTATQLRAPELYRGNVQDHSNTQ